VAVHLPSTEIIYINRKAQQILGTDDLLSRSVHNTNWHFIDTSLKKIEKDCLPVMEVLRTGLTIEDKIIGYCNDGTIAWLNYSAVPIFDEKENISCIIVNFVEIKNIENEIPFKQIVEKANDVIVVTTAKSIEKSDNAPEIIYVNKSFEMLTGFKKSEAIGNTPRMLQGDDTSKETLKIVKKSLMNKEESKVKILNYTKDNVPYWLDLNIIPLTNESGEVTHFAAIERDITDIVNKERDLKQQAIIDPLTSILNRRGIYETIESSLQSYSTEDQIEITTCIIDIDLFKSTNDSYGHDVGDIVIKQVTSILKKSVDDSVIVGRLGGEEFVAIFHNISEKDVIDTMERYREEIDKRVLIEVGNHKLNVTVSIGVSSVKLSPKLFKIEKSLKLADIALYNAKRAGRNRIESS
jgi:diguanylate cyclase (GGDEF)-like protein/PAS domain S-box-containing protein